MPFLPLSVRSGRQSCLRSSLLQLLLLPLLLLFAAASSVPTVRASVGTVRPVVPNAASGRLVEDHSNAVHEARLQRLPQLDADLCLHPALPPSVQNDVRWNVVAPQDGAPVALLVQNNDCPVEQLAHAVLQRISPQNVVKFLVLVDNHNTQSAHDPSPWSLRNPSLPDPAPPKTQSSNVRSPIERQKNNAQQRNNQDASPSRSSTVPLTVARRAGSVTANTGTHDSLTVVRVSHEVGQSLMQQINEWDDRTKAHGGQSVLLKHDTNHKDRRKQDQKQFTVTFWICMSVLMCCACCLARLHMIWDDAERQYHEQREEERREAQRRRRRNRRRKLTKQQVKENFPIFVLSADGELEPLYDCTSFTGFYSTGATDTTATAPCSTTDAENDPRDDSDPEAAPEASTLDGESDALLEKARSQDALSDLCSHLTASLDQCMICLDDYEPGSFLQSLPCRHVFHSKCITKWLTERSATCPLCKEEFLRPSEEELRAEEEQFEREEEERRQRRRERIRQRRIEERRAAVLASNRTRSETRSGVSSWLPWLSDPSSTATDGAEPVPAPPSHQGQQSSSLDDVEAADVGTLPASSNEESVEPTTGTTDGENNESQLVTEDQRPDDQPQQSPREIRRQQRQRRERERERRHRAWQDRMRVMGRNSSRSEELAEPLLSTAADEGDDEVHTGAQDEMES